MGARGMECEDHLGNKYGSISSMCEHYNISATTYKNRLNRGCTVEEALLGNKNYVYDHLGKRYDSINSMCSAYNIDVSTYRYRRERGISVEEALTGTDRRAIYSGGGAKGVESTDHLGNVYSSFREMCKAYGMVPETVNYRLRNGMSLKQALTKQANSQRSKHETVEDPFGRVYESEISMCRDYGISEEAIHARNRSGKSMIEYLNIIESINKNGISGRHIGRLVVDGYYGERNGQSVYRCHSKSGAGLVSKTRLLLEAARAYNKTHAMKLIKVDNGIPVLAE